MDKRYFLKAYSLWESVAEEASDRDNMWATSLLGPCQSPIEEAFYFTYLMKLAAEARFRPLCENRIGDASAFVKPLPPALGKEWVTTICPQVQIDKYRADFVVQKVASVPVDSRMILVVSPMFIVECDGHDFHERTADQATRDKSRDRSMLASGQIVMRFTGREIFQDVEACVMEVDDAIDKFIHEKSEEMGRLMDKAQLKSA